MTRTRMPFMLFAALIVVLLIINVIFTHNLFTAPFPGHNDFMSRWEGARSFWIDGLDPYGEQASLNIQGRIYGRPAEPNEDPGYFAYPFYTVLIVAPFVLTDYAWASAVWMVLLEVCLIGALLLNLSILKWRPHSFLLTILVLWAIFDYFAMRGLLLGQPGIVVYVLEVAAIWALVYKRDGIGGVALALSTLKPQMGFFIVPLILLFVLREQRWRYLGAFAVTFGGLMLASFALLPSWFGDWLGQVSIYTTYTAIGSPVWIVTQYYLGLGDAAEYTVIAVLVATMLFAWYHVIFQRKTERLLWTVALTLTVTHLIAVRTATTHYVVFTLPILYCIRALSRTRLAWSAYLTPFVLVGITWVHFVTTVQGEFEHPTLYLPLPFITLVVLIVTRKQWWRP